MRSKSPLLAVFLTVVIDLLGFGIVLPLLPLYAEDFNASRQMVALLFISFSVMQFIAAPLWGRLSDRIGRRPVILVGLVGSFLSYGLFGLAPLTSAPLEIIFLSRILAGTFGGTISTAFAYIADVTTKEERARGMALIGAAFGIGFTFGPAVGGLGHALHPTAPGFLAAGFSLLALYFAYRRLPEPERRQQKHGRTWLDIAAFRRALKTPGVAQILATGFFAVACFGLLEATLSLLSKHVLHLDTWQIGLVFSYFGFWSALNQGVIVRRMLKRVPEERMLMIGPLLLAGGLIGLALAEENAILLFAISPLAVLGFGMITPSLSSLLSRRTAPEDQGGTLGLNQSLQSLARIVGPYVGITLFYESTVLPFYAGAAAMAIPLLLAFSIKSTRAEERY